MAGAGAGSGAGSVLGSGSGASAGVSAGAGAGAGASGSGCAGSAAAGRGSMTGSGALVGGSLGFGAGFGAVDCLNMLAQVFTGGAGAGFGAEGAEVGAGVVVDVVEAGWVAAEVSAAGASSLGLVFHSDASSVGTERGWLSLERVPLVEGWAGLPRAPPRPRPRPPSAARPPREARGPAPGAESVGVPSAFALVRVRSFLILLETSLHREIVPESQQFNRGQHRAAII